MNSVRETCDGAPPEDAARMIYARELPPVNVESTLTRPCNDCHSSRTVWPWYSHMAPVSWMLASHVNEGRADLNFSEWAAYVRTVGFAMRSSISGTLDSAANRSRSPMRQNTRRFPNSITLWPASTASSGSCGAHVDSATAELSRRAVILGSAATVVLMSVSTSALAFEA
jgi:hypothetical protein